MVIRVDQITHDYHYLFSPLVSYLIKIGRANIYLYWYTPKVERS